MNLVPTAIYHAFFFVSLLLMARDHGKPRSGKDNFWTGALAVLLICTLFWWSHNWSMK